MATVQSSSLVPFGDFDETSLGALENLFTALTTSEDKLAIEGQKTKSEFDRFVATMRSQFTILSEENRKLREQVIASKSREREIEVLHQAEIGALQGKVGSSEKAVETMRKDMLESARKGNACVAATTLAQTAAVEAATLAGNAKVAATRQAVESMVACFITGGK